MTYKRRLPELLKPKDAQFLVALNNLGLSVRRLSEIIGVSNQTVYGVIRGISNPKPESREKIVNAIKEIKSHMGLKQT